MCSGNNWCGFGWVGLLQAYGHKRAVIQNEREKEELVVESSRLFQKPEHYQLCYTSLHLVWRFWLVIHAVHFEWLAYVIGGELLRSRSNIATILWKLLAWFEDWLNLYGHTTKDCNCGRRSGQLKIQMIGNQMSSCRSKKQKGGATMSHFAGRAARTAAAARPPPPPPNPPPPNPPPPPPRQTSPSTNYQLWLKLPRPTLRLRWMWSRRSWWEEIE